MRILNRFVAAGILNCLLSSLLLSGQHGGRKPEIPVVYHDHSATSLPAKSKRDATFLKTLFLPNTIPAGGIPVLENALGDIIHDSIVNILDLLRLRDIVVGKPPSPTSYELSESDLTHDGKVDQADLSAMRDILLRKAGVPYLVDSTGGKVLGNGITLTFPPGAVDSTIIISLQRKSESEFGSEFGIDTKSAIQDSAYFMVGFQIASSRPDFKLPFNATVRLDSVPPCAYQGLNGLFAAVPDRDGDGKSELFLINELQLNGDSLTLTTAAVPVPLIQSLSSSQASPGENLIISGKDFGITSQSIKIQFIPLSGDTVNASPESAMNDSAIFITVPHIQDGQYRMRVRNVMNGVTSNFFTFNVLPPSVISGDIRAIIVNFYFDAAASMDSRNPDSLYGSIGDSTVRDDSYLQRQQIRTDLDSMVSYYTNLNDSIISQLAPLASFIQNLSSGVQIRKSIHQRYIAQLQDCAACLSYIDEIDEIEQRLAETVASYNLYAAKCGKTGPSQWACDINDKEEGSGACEWAEGFRVKALSLTDAIARLEALEEDCMCRNCGGGDCDKCPKTTFVGFGPQSAEVFGGYDNFNWYTRHCCLNLIKYQRNECTTTLQFVTPNSPVPLETRPDLQCPGLISKIQRKVSTASFDSHPHRGSIIKVTNAPVPYNIEGILNENGKAFIPHVPCNTKVTFSLYDPVTGLYDPDVGTYTTGPTPGGFDRPLLLFKPNTTIRTLPLSIGDQKHDSVSLDLQRIDYLVAIGNDDTSKLLNIGFSASARLALRIDDPDGNPIFDNPDLSCYANAHLRFKQTGMYRLRLSYGVAGQAGSFDLGLSVSPFPPLPANCLCGNIVVDTLFLELSPYMVKCVANVISVDTISTEPGVTLEFAPGGSVTVSGSLSGIGTPVKPIILKPADIQKQKVVTVKVPVSKGKEVAR